MSVLPALDVVAVLLVIAGVAKLRDPQPVRAALQVARLPSGVAAIRAAGVAELAVGSLCIVWPERIAVLGAAALYLVFAFVIARQIRSGSTLASCGCLGGSDAPPAWVHVLFNVTAAVIGCSAAFTRSSSLLELAASDTFGGLVVLIGTVVAARLAVVVFIDLPSALGVYRSPSP